MNRRTLSICLVLFLLLALSFVSLFGPSRMASAQVAPTPTPTATVAGVDLVISSVTWSPYAPLAKQSVTFSATIKNAGSVASPAGVIHDVRFTITSGVHPTTYIMSTSYTQSLSPGASAT
ncbi:MAG: CARDB domain-containing protein, partial [Anaerolineales bacterium]